MESSCVLTAFTRVAAGSKLVHGKAEGLMRLLGQRSERYSARNEMLHYLAHRLYLINGDSTCAITLAALRGAGGDTQQVTDEQRFRLFIYQP